MLTSFSQNTRLIHARASLSQAESIKQSPTSWAPQYYWDVAETEFEAILKEQDNLTESDQGLYAQALLGLIHLSRLVGDFNAVDDYYAFLLNLNLVSHLPFSDKAQLQLDEGENYLSKNNIQAAKKCFKDIIHSHKNKEGGFDKQAKIFFSHAAIELIRIVDVEADDHAFFDALDLLNEQDFILEIPDDLQQKIISHENFQKSKNMFKENQGDKNSNITHKALSYITQAIEKDNARTTYYKLQGNILKIMSTGTKEGSEKNKKWIAEILKNLKNQIALARKHSADQLNELICARLKTLYRSGNQKKYQEELKEFHTENPNAYWVVSESWSAYGHEISNVIRQIEEDDKVLAISTSESEEEIEVYFKLMRDAFAEADRCHEHYVNEKSANKTSEDQRSYYANRVKRAKMLWLARKKQVDAYCVDLVIKTRQAISLLKSEGDSAEDVVVSRIQIISLKVLLARIFFEKDNESDEAANLYEEAISDQTSVEDSWHEKVTQNNIVISDELQKNFVEKKRSAHKFLGMIYMNRGEYDKAADHFKLWRAYVQFCAESYDPKNVLKFSEESREYLEQGFPGQCQVLHSIKMTLKRSEMLIKNPLRDAMQICGEIKALESCLKVSKKGFVNYQIFYLLAHLQFFLRQYDQAIENLQKATSLKWEHIDAYLLLAQIYCQKQMTTKKEEQYDKLIDIAIRLDQLACSHKAKEVYDKIQPFMKNISVGIHEKFRESYKAHLKQKISLAQGAGFYADTNKSLTVVAGKPKLGVGLWG